MISRICLICEKKGGEDIVVVGDPFRFAIIYETVECWNSNETFHNGLLFFSINSKLYPYSVDDFSSTLASEIPMLVDSLKNIVVNKEMYNLKIVDAYTKLYNAAFPDDYDLPYEQRYFISPPTMAQFGYYIFAVTNSKKVRILASKLKYDKKNSTHKLNNIKIREVYVPCPDIDMIITRLNDWRQNL